MSDEHSLSHDPTRPPPRRGVLRRAFASGAAMSVACGTTMLVASRAHRGRAWAGIDAMTAAVGLTDASPFRRRHPAATLLGAGILTGGLLVWGALYEGALGALGRRRGMGSGAVVGLAGFAVDRFLLGRLVPELVHAMGPVGTFAKYAALALAAARPN